MRTDRDSRQKVPFDGAARAVLAVALVAALAAVSPRTQAQVTQWFPRAPQLDKTINAGTSYITRAANFGYSFGVGKLGTTSDTLDDIFACAINKEVSGTPRSVPAMRTTVRT